MQLKPGMRLHGSTCTTEVVVVRAPTSEVDLSCCGAPMEEGTRDGAGPSGADGGAEKVQLGKRYTDEVSELEVLCTKAGDGPLSCDGRTLEIKAPKPLPSSD